MNRSLSFALVLASLLLAAVPARAQNELSLRFSNGFYPSAGLDLVSENDHLFQVELSYARELVELWRGSLWAEGSYLLGGTRAESFGGALESQALFQTITVGVVYRLPVWRFLVPHARLGLGVLVGNLGLTPRGGEEVLDRSVAFAGHLLAGAELLWPRHPKHTFTFGVVVEGGYSFSSPLGFEHVPTGGDDELRLIPGRGVELGSLVLHGGQLRVGAVFRF